MKHDKRVERQHKLLNEEFDRQILSKLDKIGDTYFAKYAPVMQEVQQIVDDCYSHTKLTEDEYDKYVYRFVDLGFANNGDNRVDEIKRMLKEVNGDYSDIFVPLIKEYIIIPLQRCGINGQRVVKECQRAEFRLVKSIKRYEEMQIAEIDNEFVSVVLFASRALIDYGHQGRVIWKNEVENVEVETELDEVYGVVKTDDIKFIIDMAIDNGYTKVRQTGSHTIWKHKNGNIVVIPVHGKTINLELGLSIQKQIIERKEMVQDEL